jgi:phosphatidylglycerophosphate synthase
MPIHPAPYRDCLLMVTAAVAVPTALDAWLATQPAVLALTATAAATLATAALWLRAHYPDDNGFGWADRVTLARLAITAVLAGQLAGQPTAAGTGVTLAAMALLALVLDGIDGWLARRRGEASAFGARLDMETDAVLILILCALIWAGDRTGAWVLAIGGLRYAFLMAQTVWPRLAAALPPSQRRRAVCAIQVGVLPICLLPAFPTNGVSLLAATALVLLCYSFTVDIHWLIRHGRPEPEPE